MKPKRRRQVATYLRDLADRMELRDWTVRFLHEPCGDGSLAECRVVYGRKWVDVQVCSRFFDMPPDEQRQTLVHELVHCHFDAVEGVMRDARQAKAFPKRARRVVEHAQHRAVEHGVDAVAEALAPHMPMPPWVRR